MTDSPVVHIVLVRLKSDASEHDLQHLTELVKAFPSTIPGVLTSDCGPSTSPEGKEGGFDWALAMRFTDTAARDGYLPHPEHEPVKKLISQMAAEVVVFDLDA